MNIAFICHSADRTGAPRIGFDIAARLGRQHAVTMICKRGGPFLEDPSYRAAFAQVEVTNTSHDIARDLALDDRIEKAMATLRRSRPEIVYVNSAAAAEWCLAARALALPVVLHAHELRGELLSLMRVDSPVDTVLQSIDLLVSASREATRDLIQLNQHPAPSVLTLGAAIDVTRVLQRSTEAVDQPLNAAGAAWIPNGRRLVSMCGEAQPRKGADLFMETARLCPAVDFLWIGPWSPEHVRQNRKVFAEYEKRQLPNLYTTGPTDNPYAHMQRADVFALTSREDPNPLVVLEALALGKRVVCFANTGGSRDWLDRHGYVLGGSVDPTRLAAFLGRLLETETETETSPDWLLGGLADLRKSMDIGHAAHRVEAALQDVVSLVASKDEGVSG